MIKSDSPHTADIVELVARLTALTNELDTHGDKDDASAVRAAITALQGSAALPSEAMGRDALDYYHEANCPCVTHQRYVEDCPKHGFRVRATTPTEAMIDEAAALYVADECNSIEEARLNIERVRKFMSEGITAEHDGDCTKQCHTCLRCLTEGYLRQVGIFHAMSTAQEPALDDDAELIARMAGAIGEALDLSPELKIDMQHSGNFTEAAAAALKEVRSRLSPTPGTGLIERVAGAIQRHFMAKHGGPIGPDYAKTCAEAAITALANAAPAQVESDMRNTLRTVEFRLALRRITERYPPDTIAGRLAADVLAKYPNRYESADRENDCEPFPIPEIEGLLLGGEGAASRPNQATKGDGL